MLTAKEVVRIHDRILMAEGGLSGCRGLGVLESALFRVTHRVQFEGTKDGFERSQPCMRW